MAAFYRETGMTAEQRFHIAVIDSDPMTMRLIDRLWSGGAGHRLRSYEDSASMLQHSEHGDEDAMPDAVILGLEADGIAPLSALARIRSAFPGIPVVILTDSSTQELAEEALRRGAADYFHRPIDLRRLRYVLPRLIEEAMCRRSAEESDTAPLSMDAAKARAVRLALAHTDGNIRDAARLLGIGRTTMYKLMERYAIVRSHTSDTEL
jgi:two-component system response regulator RegA